MALQSGCVDNSVDGEVRFFDERDDFSRSFGGWGGGCQEGKSDQRNDSGVHLSSEQMKEFKDCK